MAAADFYHKVGASTATTLSSPGYTVGNTSINVASTTNYPTDTGVTITIDEIDGNGERVAGTRNVFRGDVASATQINELVYAGGDANRNYSAGATTRVYIEVNEVQMNRMIDGTLVEHNQDGTHAAVTATSLAVSGATTLTGAAAFNGGFTSKLSNEWVGGSGTWTYASASTFTVPAADAALMSVGTKIWITQTTSKWFYVTGISGTTITVTAGSDYTVANAAITAPYFSNATTPVGFPDEFNWTPTWTNVSGGTNNYAIFSMIGKHVTFRIKYTLAGAGVSGAATFSLPVTAAASQSGDVALIGQGYFLDNGNNTYPGQLTFGSTTTMRIRPINAAGTYATAGAETSSTVPFTFGSPDTISAAGVIKAA